MSTLFLSFLALPPRQNTTAGAKTLACPTKTLSGRLFGRLLEARFTSMCSALFRYCNIEAPRLLWKASTTYPGRLRCPLLYTKENRDN